jgi:hypothetical protein
VPQSKDLQLLLLLLLPFPLHQPKTLVISERSEEPPHSLLPLLLRLLLLFSLRQNRHFDRSSSRSHRELRSGEIRFSTHASSQPTNCL